MPSPVLITASILLVVAIVPPGPNARTAAADNRHAVSSSAAARSAVRQRRVRQLIGQLDADLRSVRVRATRELLRLGPEILPDLPPPELLPDAAVRQAVRRIRLKLERQQAAASVRSTRVTLRRQTRPLAELLRIIGTATRNRIDVSGLPAATARRRFTVEYDRKPFWEVIDDLAARGKLHVVGDGGAVTLSARNRTAEPREVAVCYSGPFRIAVEGVERKPLLGNRDHNKLRLCLSLLAEPRLRPLFLTIAAGNIKPTATGTSIVPLVRDARYERPLGEGGKSAPLLLDFKIPASARFGEIDLGGRMSMTTAAGEETIRFRQPTSARDVARRRGGVTVTLRDMTFGRKSRGERSARVRVAVSYDTGGPAFESHRTWVFHNRVYLLTKDGRRIDRSPGLTTSLQADGAVAVGYRFDHLKLPPADYDFVYVAPTLIIDVPIEFTLKKLPVSHD